MLDLNNPLPLYVQLREIMRCKIEDGTWKVGDQIPGEPEIVKKYGVARATVRQAILDLVNEGLLYRKQGKGTFVCRARRLDVIEPLISFSAEMTSRGMTPGAEVLCSGSIAELPPAVAGIMGTDTPVFKLERLRTADGVPLALEYSYLNEEVVPGMDTEDLQGSLYQLITHRRQIQVSRVIQSISCSLADEEESERLHISPDSPVLVMERVMYTADEQAFYWLKFIFRGDLYRIDSVLERDKR